MNFIRPKPQEEKQMDMVHISIGAAGIIVLMGMAVVFLGLFLLMLVVQIMIKIMIKKQKNTETALKITEPEPQVSPVIKTVPALGTAGELKLYNTDPRDAAMIMAIVADATGKPLNELRFKSIREIKEGDNCA